MTYPRVNLLKANEQRYQGVVSRRFLLVGAVVAPILFVAVLSAVKLVQYSGIQSALKSNRAVWSGIEPRLALFKSQQRGLVQNRQALGLFDGWVASQASFADLLDEIRDTVPGNIQFTRLSVRSAPGPGLYADAQALGLPFKLAIEGVAQGVGAESEVIQLCKDLFACDRISAMFGSVKLASMRKRDGVDVREFRIEHDAGEALK